MSERKEHKKNPFPEPGETNENEMEIKIDDNEGALEEGHQMKVSGEQEELLAKGQPDEETTDEETDEISEFQLLAQEVEAAKDKYLRLYSEFENFRRRTARERLELIKTANEDLVLALLPVVDDFERAREAMPDNGEASSVKEGVDLIYNKLKNVLAQKGLKPMEDPTGMEFNDEYHEAITRIPAPSEELKGKIVEVLEKGYFLNDKVIRFAKVVIGA